MFPSSVVKVVKGPPRCGSRIFQRGGAGVKYMHIENAGLGPSRSPAGSRSRAHGGRSGGRAPGSPGVLKNTYASTISPYT